MEFNAFLFLVGGTLVAIGLQVFVLYFVFQVMFKMEGNLLLPFLFATFAGTVVGVFISALFPPLQPLIAALIITALLLWKFEDLVPAQRGMLVVLNFLLAFGAPIIRMVSGV